MTDNLNSLIDNYFNSYTDKSRCYCASEQDIKFQPSHIELFRLHDDIPKVQFLLAYYNQTKKNLDETKKYIDLAIRSGIGLAHNISGDVWTILPQLSNRIFLTSHRAWFR